MSALFQSRYGSRKFLLAVLVVALTSWLTYERSIDGDVFKFVISAVVAAYLTSNVAQKATAKTDSNGGAS